MKRLLLVWCFGVLLAGLELSGLLLARELLTSEPGGIATVPAGSLDAGPDFHDALRFPLR